MDDIKFWKTWNKQYQYFLLGLAIMPIVAIVLFCISYFVGDGWFYSWEPFVDFENIYVPSGSFVNHYQEFRQTAYNYIIFES